MRSRSPFLGKLLRRMHPGADYFTDHSDLLSHPNPPRSIRTHSLFKTDFQHASGGELYLSRILIICERKRLRAGSESQSQPEVFEPPLRDAGSRPPKWPDIGKAAALELEKLSPFRTVGHTGIIAHYHVAGLTG